MAIDFSVVGSCSFGCNEREGGEGGNRVERNNWLLFSCAERSDQVLSNPHRVQRVKVGFFKP